MPDTGWLDFANFASVDGAGNSWANPANASASDNSYASMTPSIIATSNDHHHSTSPSANVPAGATIDGIEIQIERNGKDFFGSPSTVDDNVQLIKGGVRSGTDKSAGNWPTTEQVNTYGGQADLWGFTLTPADVNAADFGFAIRASNNGIGQQATIDHVQVKIYYTGGGGSPAFIPQINII